mgnify:CR=1 FL=1
MSVMQQGSLQSQYFSTIFGLTVDRTYTSAWHYPQLSYPGISSPEPLFLVKSMCFLCISLLIVVWSNTTEIQRKHSDFTKKQGSDDEVPRYGVQG